MLIDPTDPADLARAHAIQDQVRLRTLEQWRSDRAGNPVTAQRDISPPDDLHPDFGILHSLGEVLRAEHLRPADLPLVEQFADIGLTVTGGFDGDHLLRAAVARDQIYVKIPEEGIYPLARNDADGEALTGSEHYRVHFRSGTLPPVAAFWSITLYDNNGFLVPEDNGRWAVGDRTAGLVRRDGSATIGQHRLTSYTGRSLLLDDATLLPAAHRTRRHVATTSCGAGGAGMLSAGGEDR